MTVTVIGDNTGDDYAGTEDTQLKEGSPTTNYETSDPIEITKWAASDYTHSVVSFSGLSNVSVSDTVSAATLNLYIVGTSAAAAGYADIRRLLRNWVVSQVTWDDYATSSAWTAGGAEDTTNDRSSTITGTMVVDTSGGYYGTSAANLVTDVQNFVDGTWSNYGWHYERNGASHNQFTTVRTETGTDGQRPYLSVTHAAVGAVIPLLLQGMGGGFQKNGGFVNG